MASSSAIPEAIVVSTMAILSDKLLAFEKEQGSDMAYEYRLGGRNDRPCQPYHHSDWYLSPRRG